MIILYNMSDAGAASKEMTRAARGWIPAMDACCGPYVNTVGSARNSDMRSRLRKEWIVMATKIIKLKIQEEEDLYSPFDPDRKMISEDIASYISRNFEHTRIKEKSDYVIEIKSDSPVDEENVKSNIRDYFNDELDAVKYSLKRLSMKAACLFVFGTIALAVWFFLSATYSSVNLEILSIIGWVAIWEATSVTIMGKHDLREQQRDYERASKAEIKIEVSEQ